MVVLLRKEEEEENDDVVVVVTAAVENKLERRKVDEIPVQVMKAIVACVCVSVCIL